MNMNLMFSYQKTPKFLWEFLLYKELDIIFTKCDFI